MNSRSLQNLKRITNDSGNQRATSPTTIVSRGPIPTQYVNTLKSEDYFSDEFVSHGPLIDVEIRLSSRQTPNNL